MSKRIARSAAVNMAVRHHAERASAKHRLLYRWGDRLRRLVGAVTGVDVSPFALSFERGPRQMVGWFEERDGLELTNRISMNTRWEGMPRCWQLECLAHETLHAAEAEAGQQSIATRSQYHPVWFVRNAAQLGIDCDSHGYSTIDAIAPNSPFGRLLRRHRVKLIRWKQAAAAMRRREGHQEKDVARDGVTWSCGCTNVRARVRLRAVCTKCGKRFRRKP